MSSWNVSVPRPLPRRSWTRFLPLLGAILFLVLLLASPFLLRTGTVLYNRRVYNRAVQECLAYNQPAGQVIYEEDPARVDALLAQPGYEEQSLEGLDPTNPKTRYKSAVRQIPVCVAALAGAHPFAYPGEASLYLHPSLQRSPVFIHERHTPDGRRALVVVLGNYHSFYPYIFATVPGEQHLRLVSDPFSGERPSINFYGPHKHGTFRLYAGQPDPLDPTAFLIPFEYQGKPGVIRGSLTNDPRLVHYTVTSGTVDSNNQWTP